MKKLIIYITPLIMMIGCEKTTTELIDRVIVNNSQYPIEMSIYVNEGVDAYSFSIGSGDSITFEGQLDISRGKGTLLGFGWQSDADSSSIVFDDSLILVYSRSLTCDDRAVHGTNIEYPQCFGYELEDSNSKTLSVFTITNSDAEQAIEINKGS